MSTPRVFALTLACVLVASQLTAAEQPGFQVTRLGDHLYELGADAGGYQVKVVASIGKDGVLLVDTAVRGWSEALLASLGSLGGGPPKIVINTHAHTEHITGNIPLGKDVLVIGHENLRSRIQADWHLWEEFPPEALPRITFADSMNLYFNGEQIRLLAFPGAHDNCDIVVWFTGSKVACVGALVNGHHFPSVDGVYGDVMNYPEVTNKVLDALPADVKLVPGHGEDCTMEEGREFHKMLLETTEAVRRELAKGKDLHTLQAEGALQDWKSWEISYVDVDSWTEYLAKGIQGTRTLPPIAGPLYVAYKARGSEGAMQRFQEIKANQRDQVRWEDMDLQLVRIAGKLVQLGKQPDAVPFFELCLTEYPQGQYVPTCHENLGDACLARGEKEAAIEHYRAALARDPMREEVAKKLEALTK